MNKYYGKNFLIAATLTIIVSSPFIANAASEWITTSSVGRFEYDTDKDGTPDVAIDSKDVDKISNAENNNATNISNLQSKYNSLITSLNTAQTQVDNISSSGTANASNLDKGMTAIVKGNLITGTRTLAAETPGTATAANISKDKTAWVNGVQITGTGTDSVTNIHAVRINFTWTDAGGGSYSGYTYATFNDAMQCTSASGSLASAGQRNFTASATASK